MKKGNIPVLSATGLSLAEAWENSLLVLWHNGAHARTQYDRKDKEGNYIDPPSVDCTMLMVVYDPLSDPMLHRAFPGGLEDLEEYRQELVDGVKDHWVRNPNDPLDKRWDYTYHGRLATYPVGMGAKFNQLDWLVDMIAETPYTRRAIAHTWRMFQDNFVSDPPCLQTMWLRGVPVDDHIVLNMNVHFRSRDAYDAAFMNCFAVIMLMKDLANKIAEKAGCKVILGRYTDLSDSYHIYGSRHQDFRERFLKLRDERPFETTDGKEGRTWPLSFAEPIFEEARPRIAEKIKAQDSASVMQEEEMSE